MWGLSGALAIIHSMLSGRKQHEIACSEAPNMLFLYWLAVVSAIMKPRWTPDKQWPKLKLSTTTPRPIAAARLSAFKGLAGWPSSAPVQVPMMALMIEAFRLVMAVLTLPAFPVSVLGTVVNKKARYSLLRPVEPHEQFTYSCQLDPAVRETFSGHAEFDLVLTATSDTKGDVAWQSVLTLVLMNPKKKKGGGGHGDGGASSKPSEPADVKTELLDTWVLPENTGRAYAALDGDISPMHLYKATAALMGFPSPVANVHLLAARAEAALSSRPGASLKAPYALEIDFKKPTLLPNRLGIKAAPAGQPAAAATPFTFQVDDKKDRTLLTGSLSRSASVRRL